MASAYEQCGPAEPNEAVTPPPNARAGEVFTAAKAFSLIRLDFVEHDTDQPTYLSDWMDSEEITPITDQAFACSVVIKEGRCPKFVRLIVEEEGEPVGYQLFPRDLYELISKKEL